MRKSTGLILPRLTNLINKKKDQVMPLHAQLRAGRGTHAQMLIVQLRRLKHTRGFPRFALASLGTLLLFCVAGFVFSRMRPFTKNSLEAREVQYWDEWIRNKSFDYWTSMANRELEEDIKLLIRPSFLSSEQTIRVLDAGAGPVTSLGSVWPGRDLDLHACDALADKYDSLLQKYDADPPVRTVRAQLEKLDSIYPREYFHFVLAREVIDQVRNPPLALRAIVTVLKPGGTFLIAHDKSTLPRRAKDNAIWELKDVDGYPILDNIADRRRVNISAACDSVEVRYVNKGSTQFVRIVKPA